MMTSDPGQGIIFDGSPNGQCRLSVAPGGFLFPSSWILASLLNSLAAETL